MPIDKLIYCLTVLVSLTLSTALDILECGLVTLL